MEDIQSILKEYTEEVKRHIDVMREDFDSKVQLIAEQYDSIDKKLMSHDQRLGSIEEKLDFHSEMIGEMKEDITVIKMDIEFIKNSLKKKVDLEEFEALEKRVTLLESKVKPAS